jgi:hypothetical protein
MSAINAVRLILQADSGVTDKVSTRICPIEVPQGSTLPAIALLMVDEIDGRHLLGSNKYPVARFIVDCLGTTYQAADELGDAVSYALVDYSGSVTGFQIDDCAGDGIDFFDRGERGDIYRRRLSFAMRYRVADAA